MSAKDAQQTASGRSLGDECSERYGPLTIARTRKDDGRALLLYERDQLPASKRRQATSDRDDRDRGGGERP